MLDISIDDKKKYLLQFPFVDDFYVMQASEEQITKLYKEVREKDERGDFDRLWEMM